MTPDEVLGVVEENQPITPQEFADEMGLTDDMARMKLNRLEIEGRLSKAERWLKDGEFVKNRAYEYSIPDEGESEYDNC